MKLLVSDFDGTFDSRNSKSAIDKNIEAIKLGQLCRIDIVANVPFGILCVQKT
jgi:hypothetical protein